MASDTIDWMIQRIVEHVVMDLDGKHINDITNTLGPRPPRLDGSDERETPDMPMPAWATDDELPF